MTKFSTYDIINVQRVTTYRRKGSIIMENKRVTKVMRYTDIIALLEQHNAENGTTVEIAVEFLKNEITLLKKKNSSASKKQTENAKENERLCGLIVNYLKTQTEGKTCKEIGKAILELNDATINKISALMRMLCENGQVTKATVKGQSRFSIC